MKISAKQVKKLSEYTKAGLADCKRALEECNGDFDKAVRWVLYKGIAVSSQKFWHLVNNGPKIDPAP